MIFQETETSELKRVLNGTLPKEIDAFLGCLIAKRLKRRG